MCVIIICSYDWCSSNKSIHLIQNPLIISHVTPICDTILILSSHLRVDFPSGLLPSGIPNQHFYGLLFSPVVATWHAHVILLATKTGRLVCY
jgi:hypothetical protein